MQMYAPVLQPSHKHHISFSKQMTAASTVNRSKTESFKQMWWTQVHVQAWNIYCSRTKWLSRIIPGFEPQ